MTIKTIKNKWEKVFKCFYQFWQHDKLQLDVYLKNKRLPWCNHCTTDKKKLRQLSYLLNVLNDLNWAEKLRIVLNDTEKKLIRF